MASGNVTTTTIDAHIPDLWSKKVILATVNKSVMAPLINLDFRSELERGNTLKIESYTAAAARNKVVNTPVTYDQDTETTVDILIDKYKYVARRIERSATIQSASDAVDAYTTLASQSISLAIDEDVTALLNSTDITQNVGTITGGAYTDISDATIRNGLQLLDEAEAPEEGRYLLITPAQKNAILGISKFVEADKLGSNVPITKGLYGQIYGMNVYVTNNSANVSAVASSAGGGYPAYTTCGIFQRECFGMIMQQDITLDSAWDIDYLAWSFVTSALYGVKTIRPTFGIEVRTTSEA